MSLLLDSVIKVSVVVALALAASALLRRRSAALRHCVLSAAILCASAVPLLQIVVPSWPLAIAAPSIAEQVVPASRQVDGAAGVEGSVVLEGRIATDGRITGVRVIGDAHPDLVAAAREAVSQWLFEPTRLWGSPIDVGVTITVNFMSQP